MTPLSTDTVLAQLHPILTDHYRVDDLVALSQERALFKAWDRMLKRPVAVRVHLVPDTPGRRWFLRETEALAQLDHPSIRHVYDAHVAGPYAYRTANWIEGESLDTAMQRGQRSIPQVMAMARDLLSALEHAHARGVLVRRIVPTTLMLDISGRGVITDLRYANCCSDAVPTGGTELQSPFVAPEIRSGGVPGEPAVDLYAVSAVLYYALTGIEPPVNPQEIRRPSELRPACPAAVERVLLRALKISPDARYLTATEMLEDFVSDAGMFHEPAAAPPAAEGAGPAAAGDGWEKRLRRALGDDYELLGEIGRGGFGRVYRVRDLGLEREAALKVMHPSLTADVAVVERFRREAQLAARLQHPNMVHIHEIGGRAGLLWYTMELVAGENLAQIVRREGPWPVDRTVRLLREALSALRPAHTQGLVHRDLKPENMLIDQDGRLRITDFGLALALRDVGAARFGGATSRSGTPAFASPEQLLGEKVDHRSDLYSLAAVAYFALLGQPPFEGKTPEAILARQTTETFPPLAERRPDVPAALIQVLDQALSSDPEQRFATASEFADAITLATRLSVSDWGTALVEVAEGWARRLLDKVRREGT
jgi:serine/threonine protein kinase